MSLTLNPKKSKIAHTKETLERFSFSPSNFFHDNVVDFVDELAGDINITFFLGLFVFLKSLLFVLIADGAFCFNSFKAVLAC